MDQRIRDRAQIAVDADAAVGLFDVSGRQTQRIDVGDTASAVEDAIGFRRLLGTFMHEDHAQPPLGGLDALDADPGFDPDADPFALGRKMRHRLGVHRGQELRKGLEDGDAGTGARIDMTKFERDHDVSRLQHAIADTDGVGPGECGFTPDHLDLTPLHRAGEIVGDVLDHLLLAVDQSRPIELRLSDRDFVNTGALDLVQRMTRRHQYLLRRATAVRAGAAEVSGFDHRHRHSRAPHRAGYADTSIAAAEDHHVELFRCHRIGLVFPGDRHESPALWTYARTSRSVTLW